MKKIAVTLLFLTVLSNINAQDRVDLKDGSTIYGVIKEYIQGDHIKLVSTSAVLIELNFDEINRIKIAKKIVAMKAKGYFNATSLGVMVGTDEWGDPNINFSSSIINGYRFNRHLQLGLGIGMDGLKGSLYYPAFIDTRYNFRKGNFTPFIGLQAGITFHDFDTGLPEIDPNVWWNQSRELDGGKMGGLYLGIRNMTRGDFGYTMSIGYRFQELQEYYTDWEFNQPIKETTYLNRVDFKLGITF